MSAHLHLMSDDERPLRLTAEAEDSEISLRACEGNWAGNSVTISMSLSEARALMATMALAMEACKEGVA